MWVFRWRTICAIFETNPYNQSIGKILKTTMIEKEITAMLKTKPDKALVIENEQRNQEIAKKACEPIALGGSIAQGDSSHMLTR